MKIALCTTTIHVPHALKLMRKCSEDVKFFVALDLNSNFKGIAEHMPSDAMNSWLTPDYQKKWKCSEALGWKTLSRRNIAFLEAIAWGADLIITHDDDNIPINENYFADFEKLFGPTRATQAIRLVDGFMVPLGERWNFNGIKVSGKQGWFDPGQFLVPPVVQRGFPIQVKHRPKFEPVTDAKVGVASGLILGDSDMDAYTRIGKAPVVGDVAMLAQVGCVVDPHTYTIFNSQNSCLLRELVPAYFMMPGIGRYDDVYAALIVQRIMRERGYHVHLGQPLVLQERNEHDLIVDLRAEVEGMAHVKAMADLLDSIVIPHGWTVIDDVKRIYETLLHCEFLPRASVEAGLLWLEDCEDVL